MIRRFVLLAAAAACAAAMPIRSEVNATLQGCILGTLGGCSTEPSRGLTNQIRDELNRMGYSFVTLDPTWVHCSGACVDFLQAPAASALLDATRAKNDYITLNSAWRSSAQQYLLYKWYLGGGCGIQIAAKPGTSNHEAGLAIDTSYYEYWRPTLESHGWQWHGSSDLVHFDYVAGGSDDSSAGLLAFQRLWNRNNANKIAEDGVYGPETEQAFYNSPCDGW